MTDDIIATANRLAASWGTLAAPLRLINNRENAVFEMRLTNGHHGALRLHRPGYQTNDSISAELTWTQALAARNFPCPRPIAGLDAQVLYTDGAIRASFVEWIDAPAIGAFGDPLAGSADEQMSVYHRLGALISRLHQATDACALPLMSRPSWETEALLGDTPFWGRFWTNPALTDKESAFLQEIRQAARGILDGLPDPDIGLIHADVLQENVLATKQDMWIIDYDDSGYGFRLYDLGTALVQHALDPVYDDLRAALIDGYAASERARLEQLVPLFVMLRGLASCGWVIPRVPADDPRQRLYAERAVRIARDWAARRG
jgi:Ser/Thr protein kinase RdoA (MazF antagonist)